MAIIVRTMLQVVEKVRARVTGGWRDVDSPTKRRKPEATKKAILTV